MNVNPLTIRYGYHAALMLGRWRRAAFERELTTLEPLIGKASKRPVQLDVVTLVGPQMVPETVRSVWSFIQYVGRPKSYTLVTDGDFTDAEKGKLQSLFDWVSIVPLDSYLDERGGVPPELEQHWSHPMIRKLALEVTFGISGPCLYVDGDVEFFPGAARLLDDLRRCNGTAAFLQDHAPSVDFRIWPESLEVPLVNAGLLFFPKAIEWAESLALLTRLDGKPNWHSEQTVVAHAMSASGAQSLDPTRYILQLDDQFEYGDRYSSHPEAVCRHYVSTIRHKMWVHRR